jgi:methylglutaconyl-CoA hydratase
MATGRQAPMTEPCLAERLDGAVLTLTLDRPQTHNAIDEGVVAALHRALARARAEPAIRALALTASGKSFSAGVDLQRLRRLGSMTRAESVANALALGAVLLELASLPKPTIAAVQGPAYGGGVGLILACDIVIAAEEARFALTETHHGLLPGLVAPLLADAVGSREARRCLLTGRRFDALEAMRIGLVHEVTTQDELPAALARTVGQVLRGGPLSIAGTKRILADRNLAESLSRIAEDVADHRATAEAREGIAAFLEKRDPAWRHSQ